MWIVRHWAVGLRAVARHWGLSMPSKVASLPSHVSMLFFGLVYWAIISLTSPIWSLGGYHVLGVGNMVALYILDSIFFDCSLFGG